MRVLIGYVSIYGYITIILLSALMIKKKLNVSDEISRKFVHIFISFTWLIMIYFFRGTFHILIPGLTMVILNYVSYKKGIFSMMERKYPQEKSLGTVYYACSIFIFSILVLFNENFLIPSTIGLFCMAFGDGLAPFFGKKYPIGKLYNKKTISGGISVFLLSVFVILVIERYMEVNFSILGVTLIAISSSLLEIISKKGLDNLILPIGVMLVSYLLM